MTDLYNFVHDLWVIHEKELMEVNSEIDCYSTPDELLELSRTWSVESSVCRVLEKILKEMNPKFDVIKEIIYLNDGVEV